MQSSLRNKYVRQSTPIALGAKKKSLKSVVWFGSVQFSTQKPNAGIMHLFTAS